MKKTTLFTTLALVVIVAIALSTATFAWYASTSLVSTEKMNVQALTAGADIEITQQPTVNGQKLKNAIIGKDDATYNAIATGDFKNWDGSAQGTNEEQFKTTFKIQNKSVTNKVTVTITATVSDVKLADGTSDNSVTKIMVAVKKSTDTNYTLLTTGATKGTTREAKDQITLGTSETFTVDIDKQGGSANEVTIDVIIWIDGVSQTNAQAGATAKVQLNCNGQEASGG